MMTVSEMQNQGEDTTGMSSSSSKTATRHTGRVVVSHDVFGFIKCPELESRVYFNAKDCRGSKIHKTGTKVEFVLETDPKSGKVVAKHVARVGTPDKVTSKGESPPKGEIEIPGTFTGVVQALPKAPMDVHVDDGMISFIDQEGGQQQAMFGNWRVARGGVVITLGQPVEFRVALNPSTRVYKALDVCVDETVVKAMEKMKIVACEEEKETTDMGKVVLLKKEFGFIKRLGHAGDLFFHFSEVDSNEHEGKLNIGDDVSFVVRHDADGRPCACKVTRAPPGSVQFEVVSEELYHGVVIEKPAVSKSYEKLPGVIDFVERPVKNNHLGRGDWASVPKSKLLFYANENEGVQALRNGDHIMFKIITDINALTAAKLAGKDALAQLIARRATQIQPIRGFGTIVDMKDHKKGSKGYGFLTWNGSFSDTEAVSGKSGKSAQHRLFFQKTDLQQSETFQIGDTVYFTLHSNKSTDDMAATRIRMKEKASTKNSAGETERLPLKLQQRHLQAHQPHKATTPMAMPRVPDGTRGFTMTRDVGKDAQIDEDTLLGMCCGFRLKGVFPHMPRSLSAEAVPFSPPLSNHHD